jgi:translation initiation factor 3 subunit A
MYVFTYMHIFLSRLSQLDAAIQMELWQEAYKAIEDVHGLMMLSKKVFAPKVMAR